MKVFVFLFALVAVCSAYSVAPREPECTAPGGGGLQAVLDEFVEMIPLDDIAMILVKAISSDPEVKEVMNYLESDDFKKIVESMQKQPELIYLLEFACENLYLDLYYYLNQIGAIIGLPPIVKPRIHHRARPGLVGMLHDMLDLLPVDDLKAMFEKKLAEDEYLQLAMETIRSTEFRQLVEVLKDMSEFQDLVSRLRAIGVDVDAVVEALKKFFQW